MAFILDLVVFKALDNINEVDDIFATDLVEREMERVVELVVGILDDNLLSLV